MAAGLFYVYTDPGTVDEAEFHDWYDHEHGPARLTVPGLGPAYRYRALDELKPEWLALYELDRPDVIESPVAGPCRGLGTAAGAAGVRPAQRDRSLAWHRSVPGELVVRLRPVKVLANFDITG